uniref:Uncharacterized protein n=1 Tax=Cacopsylla melanoneura TaxID=428564 RepID=A0A8D9EZL8_9HEMI
MAIFNTMAGDETPLHKLHYLFGFLPLPLTSLTSVFQNPELINSELRTSSVKIKGTCFVRFFSQLKSSLEFYIKFIFGSDISHISALCFRHNLLSFDSLVPTTGEERGTPEVT